MAAEGSLQCTGASEHEGPRPPPIHCHGAKTWPATAMGLGQRWPATATGLRQLSAWRSEWTVGWRKRLLSRPCAAWALVCDSAVLPTQS